MAKPHCHKEAQAAPLHERGPAAMSDKNFCYLIYVAPLELKTSLKSDFC